MNKSHLMIQIQSKKILNDKKGMIGYILGV